MRRLYNSANVRFGLVAGGGTVLAFILGASWSS